MVSKKNFIDNCLIGATIPHANRGYKNYLTEIDNIAKKCSGFRCTGSAAIDLTLVASGKTDAFWQRNLNLWDMCSGVLIVKEAGGIVNNIDLDKIQKINLIASSSSISTKFQEKIT